MEGMLDALWRATIDVPKSRFVFVLDSPQLRETARHRSRTPGSSSCSSRACRAELRSVPLFILGKVVRKITAGWLVDSQFCIGSQTAQPITFDAGEGENTSKRAGCMDHHRANTAQSYRRTVTCGTGLSCTTVTCRAQRVTELALSWLCWRAHRRDWRRGSRCRSAAKRRRLMRQKPTRRRSDKCVSGVESWEGGLSLRPSENTRARSKLRQHASPDTARDGEGGSSRQ